jgi:hypothetical protein
MTTVIQSPLIEAAKSRRLTLAEFLASLEVIDSMAKR